MSAVNIPPPLLGLTPDALKRWTVQDYHRMADLGLLDPQERTELLGGQITLMAAKGTAHVTALRLLATLLDNGLTDQPVFVATQDPIQLDDFSEPEPDLVIIQGTVLDYAQQHPRPEVVALVVEVADSTLKQDRDLKDKLYAQAGIQDYWVLDVNNRQLHVFRDPTATGYGRHLILSEPNQVTPLVFPHLTLDLTAMLPPVN